MKKLLYTSTIFFLISCSQVPGIFVGKGTTGYIDEVGINAEFNKPTGLCLDDSGNLFVADMGNKLIRKVTPEGKVSTFAGIQGDNTVLESPFDCDFDSKGNLYVSNDSVINKVIPEGKISVFAGGGDIRYNLPKEGIPATEINISSSKGIAIDSKDNIYVLFGNSLMPVAVAKITQDSKAFDFSSDIIKGEIYYFITIDKEKDNFYFVNVPSPFPTNLCKISLTTKELKYLPVNNNSMFEKPFWKTFGKYVDDYDSYRTFGSMTLDKKGNIYIVNDFNPSGILKILKDETTVNVITELNENDRDVITGFTDLAIDDKRNILYFSNPTKNKIYKINLK